MKKSLSVGWLIVLVAFWMGCSEPNELGSTETPEVTEMVSKIPTEEPSTDNASPTGDPSTPASTVVTPFNEGPYGYGFRDLVGDIKATTLLGIDFSLRELWTGEDVFIFLNYTNGANQSAELRSFLEELYFPGASSKNAFKKLLRISARNVHYVFSSFDADAEVDMERMREGFNLALSELGVDEELYWPDRIHFLTDPAWQVEGWLGQFLQQKPLLWFAVDMFQKLRQVGMLKDMRTNKANLALLAYELEYFNFEMNREKDLLARDAHIVRVFEATNMKRETVEVHFPEARKMRDFDTLEVDLGNYCTEHDHSNCGDWDSGSKLYLCDDFIEAVNPHVDVACQPEVSAVEAVEEVMGTCAGGEQSCTSDDDCEAVACEGYVPSVIEVEGIAGDEKPCACVNPYGETVQQAYLCNSEGTGYEDCNCACNTVVARWITTYKREGRWVSDISPFLGFLKDGGKRRFHLALGNRYDTDLSFRLSNRGKDTRPAEIKYLFVGGRFNQDYNVDRQPFTFTTSADAKKVELVAYITGHGWGVEVANCAEFCNHTHHFFVNGQEFVKTNEVAGVRDGCLKQVGVGVVPNQFGTWPFGRSGWCPGLEVKPWVVDITDALVSGENTITYQGLFNGADYVPQPSNSGRGFGARVNMNSYLVISH
ncbi:MAG: peptide-N-glycosidase F-related protein [Myxococcota bacterium]|nr:peptide-N-glycosidase F-related protein [Myxococcota bacterium]